MPPRTYSGLNRKQFRTVSKMISSNKQLKTKWLTIDATAHTTKEMQELTLPVQGDNFNQRASDIIMLKSAKIHFSLNFESETGELTHARVIVVRSKIGPLVLADMPTVDAEPDLDKYAVLYDEFFSMRAAYTGGPINRTKKFKFTSKKIPHMNVRYDDDVSATVSQNNGVYICYSGNLGAGANNPEFHGYTQIKFFDKK